MLAHRELSLLHLHLRHVARAACRFVSHLRFSLRFEHHITLLSFFRNAILSSCPVPSGTHTTYQVHPAGSIAASALLQSLAVYDTLTVHICNRFLGRFRRQRRSSRKCWPDSGIRSWLQMQRFQTARWCMPAKGEFLRGLIVVKSTSHLLLRTLRWTTLAALISRMSWEAAGLWQAKWSSTTRWYNSGR